MTRVVNSGMFGVYDRETENNEWYIVCDMPQSKLHYGPQAEDTSVSLFVDAVPSNKIFRRIIAFLKKSDFLLNENMEQVRCRNAIEET